MPENNTCMWLQEFCGQVEAEVVSNSRNKIHQTWGQLFSPPLYSRQMRERGAKLVLGLDISSNQIEEARNLGDPGKKPCPWCGLDL